MSSEQEDLAENQLIKISLERILKPELAKKWGIWKTSKRTFAETQR